MAATIERLETYIQEEERGQKLGRTANDLSDSDDEEDEGMYEQDFGREFQQ